MMKKKVSTPMRLSASPTSSLPVVVAISTPSPGHFATDGS
jgi:hypothetical protein